MDLSVHASQFLAGCVSPLLDSCLAFARKSQVAARPFEFSVEPFPMRACQAATSVEPTYGEEISSLLGDVAVSCHNTALQHTVCWRGNFQVCRARDWSGFANALVFKTLFL